MTPEIEDLLARLPEGEDLLGECRVMILHLQSLLEPRATSLKMEDGQFDMALVGPLAERIAIALVGYYKAMNATNYIEMSLFDREEPFSRYLVTVQRAGGKTPHELRREAEAELETLRRMQT